MKTFKLKANRQSLLCLSLLVSTFLFSACKSTQTRQNEQGASGSEVAVEAQNQYEFLSASTINQSLTIATWNVEHLAFPYSKGCRPRSSKDIAELHNYARGLNADIVALQEVASREAVASLFPEDSWQIHMSVRPDSQTYECRGSGFTSTQQKVAFAVKKGINVRQVNTLSAFGLDNPGLRHGLELVVESPIGELKLLNVHMKSGCFVDNYERGDSHACKTYAQQADILVEWIKNQQQQQTPFIVLGDFNHRLSAPYNRLTQRLIQAGQQSVELENTTQNLIGCHPYYPAPIDHIWTGRMSRYTKQTKVHLFQNMAPDAMLSDHCAMTLQLDKQLLPLSNGVTWQTTSAEYRYLTRSIYRNAISTLSSLAKPNEPWVVVMDVDETILDNSVYNEHLDKSDSYYSRESWNAWVSSEKATLVPGTKRFIEAVLAHGGKLALITNRERSMDQHTWRNLQSVGLPLSVENTCLTGRVSDDEHAIDRSVIHNDKDLRRQQIRSGQASCYQPSTNGRHSMFPNAKILMQVGDNIEDFAGVTQKAADVKALITDKSLVLLPNAMYGSW